MLDIKTGFKIGKLTVLREGSKRKLPSGKNIRTVDCVCDCGKETNVLLLHFVRERTLSCGCAQKTRNGISHTKIFRVYKAIIERCEGKTKDSERYLGKGIKMCEEWKNDFMKFISWAKENGYKEGLQIDREDNSMVYSPENCRWVTPKVNCNNRDCTIYVNYKGEKKALQIILSEKGLSDKYPSIRGRISRGMDHETAIDKPIKKGNYRRKIT